MNAPESKIDSMTHDAWATLVTESSHCLLPKWSIFSQTFNDLFEKSFCLLKLKTISITILGKGIEVLNSKYNNKWYGNTYSYNISE